MKIKKKFQLMALITASAFALSACSSTNSSSTTDSTTTAAADAVQVATSFYPLTYLVQEIGGDKVAVTDLTPPGSDAHGAELAPADIAKLQKMDLVIYLDTFAPAIDEAIETSDLKNVLEIGQSVNLLEQEEIDAFSESIGTTAETTEETSHEGETTEEHAEHTDEHADHDDHDHGIYDPHFWTDPLRLAQAAPEVAAQLAKLSPENAELFTANATALAEKLTKLGEDFKSTLATKQCTTDTFIVTHLAFGYLALENNLKQIGISGFDPETEPSPARIAAIKAAAEEHKVSTIFTTSEAEKKVAESVATETGATVEILDPAATQLDPNKDYAQVMEENFKLLTAALGCN
ncbi:MAG: metal ABC transporter substrate-binding protein [Arcanobacterium sp.]|nr:metal ABC transporter substrate-binding protein [Arcanobacterium sp.]